MNRFAFPKRGVLLPFVLCLVASTLSAAVKLSSISVNPSSVTGGNGTPTCVVILTAAAGNHGAAVTITSSNTSAVASTTITVPSGQSSAAVPLTTFSVQSNANVTLTASMNGSTNVTTGITVLKPAMSVIIVSSSQVPAPGGVETVTVEMNANAPPGGTLVSLSSTSPAAPVPVSITIPAGDNVAVFTITTQQVSGTTPVTISASAYGTTAQGSFVMIPSCTLATQPQPSIPAGDQVWVDDTSGGNSPEVSWDTSQAASGTQSLSMPPVASGTQGGFAFGLPTATVINSGDSFVVYVLIDPCNPPASVGFTWSESAIGRVRGAYWGQTNAQWDSSGFWTHVGSLPAAGSWARLTFSSPDMVGGTVDVSNTYLIGGKAWFDHYGTFNTGSGCTLATQPQPSIPAGDQVWVDDTSGGNSPEVSWDTSQAASGTQSLSMPPVASGTQGGFAFGLPTATAINSGDSFVVYVLIDPCNPPASVGFTWSESAIGRVRGAYWGQTNAQWDSSGFWTHVGSLPAAGSWARLTFSSPDMVGGTVDVSNTYLIGGKAWFDHYGTFNPGCVLATQPQPSIPPGDNVWVDDTSGGLNPPDGSVYWDTTQAASGTQSLTTFPVAPATQGGFAFALPTPTVINSGDSFVVYVLIDPCNPPTTLGFTWSESVNGILKGAYWGQTNAQWDSTSWWTHVGPLPAAGSWARLTFNSPVMAGGTVDVSNTFQIGGKAWYDHYGTFQP